MDFGVKFVKVIYTSANLGKSLNVSKQDGVATVGKLYILIHLNFPQKELSYHKRRFVSVQVVTFDDLSHVDDLPIV